MRRLLTWVIFVMIPTVLCAQNRTVRGFVYDVNNQPLHNVTLTPEGGVESYKVDSNDGSFAISISYNYSKLVASCEGYISAAKYIDGSYLIFVLEVDKEAVERARREKNAEERARKEAEEKARKEAEAKEKAAAAALLAREKAIRDSIYLEEKKLKARLEEEKRQKESKERARKEAEEKARKEALAKERRSKDEAYDKLFSNHGLEHTIDVSYAYPVSTGRVIFVYSGMRDYGSTHPVELDYTLSYKFSRIVSLGAGVGVLYHLKSISILNDDYISEYEHFREKQLDVPVFARLKLNFLRTKVRPMINLQAGYYCLSGVLYGEAGLGVEYRMGKKNALQLSASARTVPWPYFNELEGASYIMSIAPSIKLGFSF